MSDTENHTTEHTEHTEQSESIDSGNNHAQEEAVHEEPAKTEPTPIPTSEPEVHVQKVVPQEPHVEAPKPIETPKPQPPVTSSSSSVSPMAEQSTSSKKPLSEALASLTFSPDKQKPLSELHARDIPLWNNAYVSAGIFLTGQILYLLFTKFEFSLVTLIGRIVLMQVVGFFLFVVGTKIIKNQDDSPFITRLENFDLSQYEHQVKTLLAILNDVLKYYVGILSLKAPKETAKFAVAVQVICWLGNKIDGLSLAYIGLWIAFTIPKIYEVKQNEIDAVFALAYSKIIEGFAFLQSKIPKAADIPDSKKND